MKTSYRTATRLLITLAVMTALVMSLVPAAMAQGGDFTVTLLHTNDVHARIMQFDKYGGSCSDDAAAEGTCFGGVARRATKIAEIRAEGGNILLVDAGDQFMGTLFFTQYKGEEAQRFMNKMAYDAMAVGNHEFDDGPGTSGSFIRGANFPVLSANINADNEPQLAGLIKPYVVLDVGGQQIGIIGCTVEDTAILSSPGPNVVFNPIEASVASAVSELEAMGINKIILLSHAGFGRDKDVAAAVDGVDVIVGGHTHTYLSSVDEGAEGPYPTVVNSPSGDPVLIVTAEALGKYLGRLDVTFDANGLPTAWQGEPILLDASVAEDADILAEVNSLYAPLEALQNQLVGSASVDINGERSSCRFEECSMGNLITDAIIWATAAEGTQIAFHNGGGTRASISAGNVSLGNVLEVLPFGNTIATFELKGEYVWAALENGVSRAENPENEGTGRFSQVGGLRFTWNPNQPAGSRVISADVKNADGTYTPLDMNAMYKVAANNFIRTGGDDYSMFDEQAVNAYDFGPTLATAVADYITTFSPVAPAVEGRITKSTEAAPAQLPVTGGVLVLPYMLSVMGLAAVGAGVVVRRRR